MKRRKPIARGSRPNAVNAKRKAREFARAYHSKERCAFVASLPCCACGGSGSENAHGPDSDAGMGRKGSYQSVLPLCGGPSGCHTALHRVGRGSFERQARLDLQECAEETEIAWQRHRGEIE